MQVGPRTQGPAIRASGALKWVFILFCVLISRVAGDFILPISPETTARVGQGFNAKRGEFIYRNLYDAPGNDWNAAIHRESKFHFDFDYKSVTKSSDVYLNLDLAVELKVGFQAGPGFLSIAAKGKFAMVLRDFATRTYKFFTMKFVSVVDTINPQTAIGPDQVKLDSAIDMGATHYVKNVIYGGEFLAEVSYKKNEEMDSFLLELSLAAKYSLPAFPGGIAAAGGFTLARDESEMAEKTEIRLYASPGQIEAPVSLLTLMSYLQNYRNYLMQDPIGSVVAVTLGDLKDFQVQGAKEVVYAIPNNFQIDAITNQLNDILMTQAIIKRESAKIDEFTTNSLTATSRESSSNNFMRTFLQDIQQATEDVRTAILADMALVKNFNNADIDLLDGMRAYGTRKTNRNDRPIFPCASGLDRFTYEMDNLLKDIDRCLDVDFCHGHGRCTIINKSRDGSCISTQAICDCDPGWMGDTCSWHKCDGIVNKYRIGPCMNSPTACSPKTEEPGYVCTCSAPFFGERCLEGVCERSLAVRGEPLCKNDAKCSNTNYYPFFRCDCHASYHNPPRPISGFLGLTCEVHYCDALEACGNRGTCHRTDDTIGYRCECGSGYTGEMCEISKCMSENPCNDHSLCVMDNTTEQGYRCDCKLDYTGPNCDQHRVCDVQTDVCKHGGTCVPDQFEPFYKCKCNLPYFGDRCEVDICTYWKHSPDHADPCEGGTANCVNMFNKIVDQVTGEERPLTIDDIETTRSFPSVDELRGEDKAFICSCNAGWTGKDCDVNVCDNKENNLCFGGVCMPRTDLQEYPFGYKCECYPGFRSGVGQNDCGISKVCTAANQPCRNGSTCTPRPDLQYGFSCEGCNVGFYGEYCEKHVCERVNDPVCKNGGICSESTENARGFVCECQEGLGGITCENDIL